MKKSASRKTGGYRGETEAMTPRSDEGSVLAIRTTGEEVQDELRARVREHLGEAFEEFALGIERVGVRFEQGREASRRRQTTCRIKVAMLGPSSVLAESMAATPEEALEQATEEARRALRSVIGQSKARGSGYRRRGEPSKQQALKRGVPRVAAPNERRDRKRAPALGPEQGSQFGRRVGRADSNLEDVSDRPEKRRRDALVDTSKKGRSATDRRSGGASTAARNTRQNLAGLTSALEDSMHETPSRVSTRRSTNRIKRDANLKLRQVNRLHSPNARGTS
jgi:hypothetical protein